MITGLRSTLAAAVQRSSTSANYAATGSDPSVGAAYMNASHPAQPPPGPPHGPPQLPPFAAYGGAPGPGPPPQGLQPGPGPQGQPPPQGPPLGHPPGGPPPGPQQPPPGAGGLGPPGAEAVAQLDRDRELDKLRRDLKKADENINFFRTQVIALQQQVSTMGMPVMGASAAAAMPEEIARLRAEIAEERAERAAMQDSHLQAMAVQRSHSEADAMAMSVALQERERDLGAAQGRVGELERDLATARQELSAMHAEREQLRAAAAAAAAAAPPPPASRCWSSGGAPQGTPTRSASGAWAPVSEVYSAAGSPPPMPHQHRTPSSQAPASFPALPHVRGDPLDPHENPGGPRRAVVVGCDYPGKTGSLRAGVADALEWARFFTKRCGMADQDVRLLCDDPARCQQRARPDRAVSSRENVLRALQWLTMRSAPGEQLFFVFCGHGAQIVAEEYAGRTLCENACVPADVFEGGEQPRLVSDSDVHRALLGVPHGAQVTLLYDTCHAGRPLDRSGLDFLTEYVDRGHVDYEKLRAHPVRPRFLQLPHWRPRPVPPDAPRESSLRCQAVHWAACGSAQFCVEIPIEDKPRGVFTYIFINALLNAGVQASSGQLLHEARALNSQLRGRLRLQQDAQLTCCQATSESQPFLRM